MFTLKPWMSAVLMTWACAGVHAAPNAPPDVVQGEVLEVRSVQAYTYLRLKTADGETWVAVPKSDVAKGARVAIEGPVPMEKFESRALERTFDRILFGTLAGPRAPAHDAAARTQAPGMARVPRAAGPEGRTVAEVIAGKSALKDKVVLVRAQVVKVTAGILGKTWVHLQDGSGAASAGTHDLLATTTDPVAVGDIVDARGTLRTDVQLGQGYVYGVLIEDARLSK